MSLGYAFKEGFSGFKRAKLSAFTSVSALLLATFLVGIVVRVGFNGYELAQSLKRSVEVEVFLSDVDESRQFRLEKLLKQDNVVKAVHYISKDSAAAIFLREFGREGQDLADLKFLPASFKVTVNEDRRVEEITAAVEEWQKWAGVEEVQFNQALLSTLQQRMETLFFVGGGLGSLILLTSIILVFNTIRLTIFAKRDLIRAMKLVGATNAFIRRPFVIEGMAQGVLAGGLAVGFHVVLFHILIPEYVPQLGVLAWPFGRWYFLLGAMFVLAFVMGWMGSSWAGRTFIKATEISGA